MADFRDHFPAIEAAGYGMAGLTVDPAPASSLLRSELFLPFGLLQDADRNVLREWNVLNEKEHDGIPVPAVFAIGAGRVVLARSIDTMVRQIHPREFLDSIASDGGAGPKRRLMFPRLRELLSSWRIGRSA